MKLLYSSYCLVGKWYLLPILIREWKKPIRLNERAVEFEFVFRWLAKLYPQRILDVGSGQTALPHLMANCGFHVTAIDKILGYWRSSFFNRHYHVLNDDVTNPSIPGDFDLITCVSVLEHITDHHAAVRGMFRLLNEGGYLILTVPYNEQEYIKDVNAVPGVEQNNIYMQQFSRAELSAWMAENGGVIVVQEYFRIFEGEFWRVGKAIYPPQKVLPEKRHHLSCILIQKKLQR